MRTIFKHIFFTLALFSCSKIFPQNDSLRILFQGDFHHEKYKLYFKGNETKIKLNKFDTFYISFPIDSEMVQDHPLRIEIWKKSLFRLFYQDTFFGAFYDTSKKYLIIYRNFKLKPRFAIEPIWSDHPFRYQ